ncbi:MAG: hypothetical protein JO180_12640 [Gemmatirosa sp.]|nr:hypothetical protein [Gemmatirosa sp.]
MTHPTGDRAAPSGAVDFFAIEASEYLDRLDALVASAGAERAPDGDALARTARALRGAATMARQAPLAELASAMEAVAVAARGDASTWRPRTADAFVAAIDGYRVLLRAVRTWDAASDARAAERTAELRGALSAREAVPARPAGIVPIARLFYDDAGPHLLQRNPQPAISADLRFRQAAVPLASTLRRLVAEARHAVDDGSRRTVGDDLRAAIRDLGELAESYDIAPVANFARAREAALARLDDRTLEVVDGAAQALVESAGTAWARVTPPASVGVVEPPAAPSPTAPSPTAPSPAVLPTAPVVAEAPEPAPMPAAPAPPAQVAPEPHVPAAPSAAQTPASGQALVELLETSISGLHRLAADAELPAFPTPAPDEPPTDADGVASIRTLEYRGRAALDRARQVRDWLRASPTPDPDLLAELYDLLDLAADEPAHA